MIDLSFSLSYYSIRVLDIQAKAPVKLDITNYYGTIRQFLINKGTFLFDLQNYSTQNIKNDILSGALVAVALVPEAIAFSFIAGVSPIVGLYGAFIIGLITALLGGKPGMISGATGAVAVVFAAMAIKIAALYPQLDKETLSITLLHYILSYDRIIWLLAR
jgi:hypothetical protein